MDSTTSLIIGILIGGAIAFVILYLFIKTKNVSKTEFDNLTSKYNEADKNYRLFEEKAKTLQTTNSELTEVIKSKDSENTQLQIEVTSLDVRLKSSESKITELEQNVSNERTANKGLQDEINQLKQKISELTANNNALNDKLTDQKTEVEQLQKTAQLQFEKIANKLFEEKSEKFTATNKSNIETLLNPLKEDITKFKEKIEATHTEETKQRTSLEERIKGLIEQTNKVSAEANNLAAALKGKSQKRGNWGEMILERILESSGLTKDREYFVQESIKDNEGKHQRLDVKVALPDNRIIIIDSKVSLIAYENYSTSEDNDEQKKYLQEHINATKVHIDQLSEKKYDNMDTSLDFTMMFIPIEPAYLLAIQGDIDLWSYAYSKRILLVSPTTLIACLKLFSDLWRREWQNKNAMEIAKRGEALYEKFVGFTKTFEEIGNSIKSSQEKYEKALGQLKDGRGNLVQQAVQLKKLGLKSDKNISPNLLPLSFGETGHETDIDIEEEE